MIREHLFEKRAPTDPMFRWRGGEVSRLEALSDGVFALTVALLVLAGSVPDSFHDMWEVVRDLPVFLVSFLLVLVAWYDHYLYFRRYGLNDLPTIWLNGAFLFVVVFMAYPLKFLAGFLWAAIRGDDLALDAMFTLPAEGGWFATPEAQRAGMMLLYGGAYLLVFGILALMLWRALRLRAVLELDELEVLLTRIALGHKLLDVGVALASLAVLASGVEPSLAGIVFLALGPGHFLIGLLGGLRAGRLQKRLTGG